MLRWFDSTEADRAPPTASSSSRPGSGSRSPRSSRPRVRPGSGGGRVATRRRSSSLAAAAGSLLERARAGRRAGAAGRRPPCRSACARSPGGRHTRCGASASAPAFEQRPLRQRPRGLDVGRVVHQRQRLERRVGLAAPRRALLARRRVERGQRRRRHGPLPQRVHAAAVEILAVALLVLLAREALAEGHLVPQADRLIRQHARAADAIVQQARSRPARCRGSTRPAGAAAGRAPAGGSRDRARAAPASPSRPAGRSLTSRSAAASRGTSQPLRTNSTASQSSSSGCDGGSPWTPKSSCVLTRPVPKYDLPEAVHRDPRGQRVGGIDQPLRQRQPGRAAHRRAASRASPGSPAATFSPGLR